MANFYHGRDGKEKVEGRGRESGRGIEAARTAIEKESAGDGSGGERKVRIARDQKAAVRIMRFRRVSWRIWIS